MSDYIADWLIGISNTDADGVTVYRFRGTRKDVKELLVKLNTVAVISYIDSDCLLKIAEELRNIDDSEI